MRTLKLLLALLIVLGTTPMALAHDDRDDRNTDLRGAGLDTEDQHSIVQGESA